MHSANFKVGFVALALTVGSLTSAQEKLFDWTQGAQNEAAGKLNRLTTTYDGGSQRLTFRANFGALSGSSNVATDGFWVALSGGAGPKGHGGELALLYFDATGSAPVLTAYNYNGQSGATSYKDGSPAGGNQTPDKINSSLIDTSWINDLAVVTEADGSKTMRFDIDASGINGHSPKYPGSTPWTGVEFGDKIGLRFHHTSGSAFTYSGGFINSYGFDKEGWLDLNNCDTVPVPEPASLAALGLGIAAILRRRVKR